jgi:hypothetical protein
VDAVIALDDGSLDASQAILQSHPLVKEILIKPPKSLAEWDDAENRLELYEAAGRFSPVWVLCLDTDERLECTFGVFRKELLGLPADVRAIAFPLVDMERQFVTRSRLAHRMYRYHPGYTFDRRRLHCRQIPLEITPEEICEINVRIFNQMGGTTERQNRIEKYRVADPDGRWQSSYAHLTDRPIQEELLPIAGSFRLRPILEDGIQGDLARRSVAGAEIGAERLRPLLRCLQDMLPALLPLLRQFHDYRVDAFAVRTSRDGFVAEYAYDSSRDVPITLEEAWLLEDLRQHRDLFLCLARLAIRFGLEAVAVPDFYRACFDALVRKSIFRKPLI